MIILIFFAFLAGVITVLSPCILPLLPIILSSSLGKTRPFGVVLGFVISFTVLTLFLTTLVKIIGIPADFLRFISILVVGLFGLSLLTPKAQFFFEKLFVKINRFAPRTGQKPGFMSGVTIGFSLGILWTPCVGPILASVIALAVSGTVSLEAIFITLSYSIGTAVPMFLIISGGQNALKRVPWLVVNTFKIQKAFGILMILTAIMIASNYDRKLQTFILNVFPGYGVGLTKLEDLAIVKKNLKDISGVNVSEKDMGRAMFELLEPKGVAAPQIIPGGRWFNLPEGRQELNLADLKGKVVVVDFWTYSCINCQRTFPYLRNWWSKYKDKGLVIIGVHSPEFEFEKSAKNLARAIADFNLTYPIVQDNNFETWRVYNNRYWPAKYFIDKEGYIRYRHFGEGDYDKSEQVIQELLNETGASVTAKIDNPDYQIYSQTPEIYLGYRRIENLIPPQVIIKNRLAIYTAPKEIFDNFFAFDGAWSVDEEYSTPGKNSKLYLSFNAKEVFLVARPDVGVGKIKVYVDEKMEYFGEDNKDGIVTVDSDRLYKLINLPTPGRHILRLEFEDDNLELYAFTFG